MAGGIQGETLKSYTTQHKKQLNKLAKVARGLHLDKIYTFLRIESGHEIFKESLYSYIFKKSSL
jgi:hypothetical protein